MLDAMADQQLPTPLVLDVASTLAEHGHDVFGRAVELRELLAGFLAIDAAPEGTPPALS